MKIKKTTLIASIGSGLEYYDFTIYALLASYISINFFPSHDKLVSLISTYLIFALAYIVRPLGGIIFGIAGDRFGRKKILVYVMLLMAAATVVMGLLPSYHSSYGGIWASALFIVCRFLQGLFFGAELPCALTFITEHTGKNYKGLNCAIMTSTITIGVLTGNAVIYLLSSFLSSEEMTKYGWRVPFILGGALALCAFLVRRNTEETPVFLAASEKKEPFNMPVFIKGFFSGLGILILPSVLILSYLVLPSVFISMHKFNASEIYKASLCGYAVSVILVPVFGYLGDKIGRKRLYASSLIVMIFLISYALWHKDISSLPALMVFMMSYQLVIAIMAGSYYPMLAENFPPSMRYTGVAAVYNISMLIASFFPIFIAAIMKSSSNMTIFLSSILCLALIALVSLFFTNERETV